MLRSQPPPLIHASELFHVRSGCGTLTPNDSGDDFYFQRGLPASPKEEDAVESQIHQNGRRAQENQDHPLNLSCKRKRMKMDLENADWRIAGSCCERKEDDSASLFPRSINKETERAVLYYRAQMLASSDLVRAILKRKLDEEIALKALQQRIENKTVPFALKNFMSHQYSYLPYNMFKYASNLSQREEGSPIIYPNVMHPKSVVSLPSPPISPDKSTESTTHNTVQFPNVTSSVCISPPQISKENYESPSFESSTSPTSSLPEMPTVDAKKLNRKEKNRLRATSSNTEMYHCSLCSASYPHKFELNRHVKVSHIRPHRCTQCGKGFGHRNYLKVHIETVHLGKKTHQCRLCGKYLSTGGNLNVHVRTIHLGEKKYNCPICSRSFGQQCNMKTHMKRHFTKGEDM